MSVKIDTKSCMTHKAGKFEFSCEYDEQRIRPLQVEAQVLYRTVADLPILPDMASQLEEELIRRSIFGTAAIEGNSLSQEQVDVVLKGGEGRSSEVRAEQEILNLQRLYAWLRAKGKCMPQPLAEATVRSVHEMATGDIEYYHNSPGRYRNEMVKVGDAAHDGVYTPPKILADIQTLMSEWCDWLNQEALLNGDQMLRAALAHYYLGLIHPFLDGNGRTARFLEGMILHGGGFKYLPQTMSNYYYRRLDAYFGVFSESRKAGNVTAFLEFFYSGVIESIENIRAQVVYSIRRYSIRDFIAFQRTERRISKRQHDLLELLLRVRLDFRLGDLFTDPLLRPLYSGVSESTARRDLRKLEGEGYLVRPEGSDRYELNLRMLG
jgi:Fic family protein